MMSLEIEALRLTEEEKNVGGLYSIHSQQRDYVAAAQLAKAAYGFYDWLLQRASRTVMAEDFLQSLEQANIERPTAGK